MIISLKYPHLFLLTRVIWKGMCVKSMDPFTLRSDASVEKVALGGSDADHLGGS